jgi:hypothetical protein
MQEALITYRAEKTEDGWFLPDLGEALTDEVLAWLLRGDCNVAFEYRPGAFVTFDGDDAGQLVFRVTGCPDWRLVEGADLPPEIDTLLELVHRAIDLL